MFILTVYTNVRSFRLAGHLARSSALEFRTPERMLECALKSMETVEASLAECQEAELFDPEFGQWHFVSVEGL